MASADRAIDSVPGSSEAEGSRGLQRTLNSFFGLSGKKLADDHPYLCLVCGKHFKRSQAMISHQRWAHEVASSSSTFMPVAPAPTFAGLFAAGSVPEQPSEVEHAIEVEPELLDCPVGILATHSTSPKRNTRKD